MTNKAFFKVCLQNELQATFDVIAALPNEQLSYKPADRSRSAYEIAEHIIAHAFDFELILKETKCDECLVMPFENAMEGAEKLKSFWEKAILTVDEVSEENWDGIPVELLVSGNSALTIPRSNMMWFFLFDIIHHRGQLSSYIRPMGGKNPTIYGWSADTI